MNGTLPETITLLSGGPFRRGLFADEACRNFGFSSSGQREHWLCRDDDETEPALSPDRSFAKRRIEGTVGTRARPATVIRSAGIDRVILSGQSFSLGGRAKEAVQASDGRSALAIVSSPTEPCAILHVSLAHGSRTMLPSPWPTKCLVTPDRIRFRGGNGLPLDGWLYRPAVPAQGSVVYFHGGPDLEAGPEWSATIQGLCAAGFGVLAPNVRGSTGRGEHFMRMDDGALRPTAFDDAREAVAAVLRELPGLFVIALGISYGALLARHVAARCDRVVGYAGLSGLFELAPYMRLTGRFRESSLREYGDDEATWVMVDSFLVADSPEAAGLVIHGQDDENVPSVLAFEHARQHGVDYIEIAGEGHGMHSMGSRSRANMAIVDWATKVAQRNSKGAARAVPFS